MGIVKPLSISGKRLSDEAIVSAFDQVLGEAGRFAGATSPNPPVGCALLDSAGNILAMAAHERAGRAHAEAAAIALARQRGLTSRIHTVVVTLEPCNHHGRTPPCTEAILTTPAEFLVIGCADPNPHVAGGGAVRLGDAGLDVTYLEAMTGDPAGAAALACRRLIAPFAKKAATGLPWITLKQALDERGSMIPPSGEKTFTSAVSLKLAHRLRRRADAIVTGSGTVLADNPSFTVRHVSDFTEKKRSLAILDRRGRVAGSYLYEARARGFEPFVAQSFSDALRQIGAAGAQEVLVEAGPLLTDHVLQSGLWDAHVVITKSAAANDGDAVAVHYRDAAFDLLKNTAWPLGDEE